MTAHVAQRLRDAAAALPVGPVSLLKLAEAHGPSAQGSLLLLLAAPCLLPVPGVGTVLGLGMIALALAMWRGDDMLGLPGRVAQVQMSHLWAQRVLRLLASIHEVAGRFAKARLNPIEPSGRCSWLAATGVLMAVIIVLPIPFGNVLPALAVIFIGVGVVLRDGVATLLGFATAGLALLLTVGMASMVLFWAVPWVLS